MTKQQIRNQLLCELRDDVRTTEHELRMIRSQYRRDIREKRQKLNRLNYLMIQTIVNE